MTRLLRLLFSRGLIPPNPYERTRVQRIVDWLKKLGPRILVILKAAPTWLVAASTMITIFAEEIVTVLPDDWDPVVLKWSAIAVGFLTAVINIIRRVTPVLPGERGILPQDPEIG